MVERIDRLLHRVDQGGRGEDDVAGGEDHPAAVALDGVRSARKRGSLLYSYSRPLT
jgi:hypothetical protein